MSDTHGVWEPALADHFGGGSALSAILHGGDVGSHGGHRAVLRHFDAMAPTTAVRGNVDDDSAALSELPVVALVRLAGWAILLVHILASPEAAAAIERYRPDIVVHGHSHKYAVETVQLPGGAHGGAPQRRLLVNPGSAGPARFRLGRTAALLHLPDRGERSAAGGWKGRSTAQWSRPVGRLTAWRLEGGQPMEHPGAMFSRLAGTTCAGAPVTGSTFFLQTPPAHVASPHGLPGSPCTLLQEAGSGPQCSAWTWHPKRRRGCQRHGQARSAVQATLCGRSQQSRTSSGQRSRQAAVLGSRSMQEVEAAGLHSAANGQSDDEHALGSKCLSVMVPERTMERQLK